MAKKTNKKAPAPKRKVAKVVSEADEKLYKDKLEQIQSRKLLPMTIQEMAEVMEFAVKNNSFYDSSTSDRGVPTVKYAKPVVDTRDGAVDMSAQRPIWAMHFYGGFPHSIVFSEGHFGPLAPMPKDFKYNTLYDWIMGWLKGEWKPNDSHWAINSDENQFTKKTQENVILRLNHLQSVLEKGAKIIAEVNKNFQELAIVEVIDRGTQQLYKLQVGDSIGYYKRVLLGGGEPVTIPITKQDYDA